MFLCAVPGDPDSARRGFRLTEREADALAQILGLPRMVEGYANLTKEVPGLSAGQVMVTEGRGMTGGRWATPKPAPAPAPSIVAIVRGEQVLASPGPAELLSAGDVLVVIGTDDGITAVRQLVDQD